MSEESKQSQPASPHLQGRMDLVLSENRMEARLRIRGHNDPSITHGAALDLLNDSGIVYGVDISAVRKLIQDYYTNPEGAAHIEGVVAKGTPAEEGIQGHVEIFVKAAEKVTIDEEGRADYRNVQRFRSVDKGQLLARLVHSKAGKSGFNVMGEEVPPAPVHETILKAGPGVVIKPGTTDYFASIHGIFQYQNDTVAVHSLLEIPNNVGLESGNVQYDGNVRVSGNIERGSVVQVQGDLEVGGSVESGEIRVGGSLTVHGGINTRRAGTIHVGRDLTCTFLDNSALTVEGDLTVEKSIIAASIITYSGITLNGKGSTVSGGEIYSFKSIAADILGNRLETPTKIILGEHYRNRVFLELHTREQEQVEKDYMKLTEEIQKIKVYVQRMRNNIPEAKRAEFRVIFNKYKEMTQHRKKVAEQVEFFRANRYNREEVRVIAREIIHPGVEIHYRGHVERFRAPLSSCILTFFPGMEKPKMEAFKQER